MNKQVKPDVLSQIIAREQQRYEVIEKNIGALSAEQKTLLKQGRIEDGFRLSVKIRKLLQKSLEIHRFICKLSAISQGVSVNETYDAFADNDDVLITELKKEAV